MPIYSDASGQVSELATEIIPVRNDSVTVLIRSVVHPRIEVGLVDRTAGSRAHVRYYYVLHGPDQ